MKVRKNIAISESGFVFDPTTGESFNLNETGAEMLQLMKQDKCDEEFQKYFLKKYTVDAATLERYYIDFVGMLKQFNLLEEE